MHTKVKLYCALISRSELLYERHAECVKEISVITDLGWAVKYTCAQNVNDSSWCRYRYASAYDTSAHKNY